MDMDLAQFYLQGFLVVALIGITAYYAIQTKRQADLLKGQIDENRRMRNEDRKRELKRHAIEFMYNWARQVAEFTFIWHPLDNKEQLLNLWESASKLRIDALEARQYSSLFDAKLRKVVGKAADNLADFAGTVLNTSVNSSTLRIPESGRDLIRESQSTANSSAQDLVTFITDLKISLKL
jgi:hypothetical protein